MVLLKRLPGTWHPDAWLPFTFHYGLIKTLGGETEELMAEALHSTMVLLKPGEKIISAMKLKLYIPLWSY